MTQPVGGRDGWFAEVPPRDDEAPGARRAVHAGCPDGALERPYRAQPCRSVERRRFSRADIPPAGQKLRVAPALCRHNPPLQPLNPRSRCATALCQTRLEFAASPNSGKREASAVHRPRAARIGSAVQHADRCSRPWRHRGGGSRACLIESRGHRRPDRFGSCAAAGVASAHRAWSMMRYLAARAQCT